VAEFIRIVSVRPNGTERIVRDIPIASVTDTQTERAAAFVQAKEAKDAGQHIRVYTSSNEVVSPGDLVYDSDIDYGGTI
jgi:hypothetical protein